MFWVWEFFLLMVVGFFLCVVGLEFLAILCKKFLVSETNVKCNHIASVFIAFEER